jgi:hypothetical protein
MNEDQREQWKRTVAAKAAASRRRRYQPCKTLRGVRGAGMIRMPAPREQRCMNVRPELPGGSKEGRST